MQQSVRLVLLVVGALLVFFGGLVWLYAGEPFNLATIVAIVGIGLIVWVARQPKRPSSDREITD